MTDRLAVLLERSSVNAELFNAGALCGVNDLAPDGDAGQLHLVREGSLEVFHPGRAALRIEQPSLLLYPRPLARRFVADPVRGAQLACAHLHFRGSGQPIAAALPDVTCLPLAGLTGAGPLLDLLFEEALGDRCGRDALVNRLFEAVLVLVLRQVMEEGRVAGGMLAGLAHPRLRHALVAIHEAPGRAWSLETLAGRAGMSRSAFAGAFRATVGATAGDYLQAWRVGLVQQALCEGRPLKALAGEVGYGSEAALSRAFKAQTGLTPRAWKLARAAA